jgi:3-isopropylmalate/(R)-2-methylmalate dehydratase small subunit
MKNLEGQVYLIGDDINTDDIVPSHTLTMRDSIEMSKHTFEFIDPQFIKKVRELNIILAGENFGTGSSREEAVNVFKILGIKAIIAKSFARIYFRNLINSGIPAITLNWEDNQFKSGDFITISLHNGIIENKTKNIIIKFQKLSQFIMEILQDGGIISKLKKELK